MPYLSSNKSQRLSAYLLIHQFLYFFGFNRNISHQIPIAILGNENIIFQTNPQFFFWNVYTRFTRKYHAGFKTTVLIANIVHVQAQEVGRAVGEKFLVCGPSAVLPGNVVPSQQAKVNELTFHKFADLHVVFVPYVSCHK